ncbi:MAG: hypothetical protein JSV33_10055 [bacterium]|nr:MAG: hypothetical protein JSV33_10055 [bacterium]
MRKPFALMLVCVLCTVLIGCGPSTKRLMGTWKLMYPEPRAGQKDIREDGSSPVKILADTHFAFGSMTASGMVFAGGGRYILKGDKYIEMVDYHAIPKLVGKTLEFTCHIDGNKWYHSGRFVVDGEEFAIEEIWLRVE